ncbi:Copper resistance protein D [Actinokineospora spheciospongiae]|uniref:Copper resistance protein D n=1 Tax=Actinokineospora spheciospongiae TaxID=909613 RepID=W7IC16_9PSEU|nr:copper resistance CopC family protein [Actinokineospora spheciospongiae]EWC58330.1 Copper resistance protein D [Actinokineospora spheciospongiae]PWW61995.1 hypothetical protein DFQ13_106246 [Actinokineospora spheciospongiae]
MRTLGRVLATAVVALLALVGLAGTAFAHNQLVGSNPADGSSVAVGPKQVELTFDQPVQAGENLNTIVVVGPDGKGRWQDGAAVVKSNVVSVGLRELGPAGTYTIGYRILSADGHSVTGELKFDLTTAGTGTPAEATADAAAPAGGAGNGAEAGTDTEDSGGVPIWVWIAGAVVLLGGGIVLAARVGGTEK